MPNTRAEHITAIQYPVLGFLQAMGVMLLFLVGAWQISIDNLTPADLISFFDGSGAAHITD